MRRSALPITASSLSGRLRPDPTPSQVLCATSRRMPIRSRCLRRDLTEPRCNASTVSGHIGIVERQLRFELLYAKHAPAVKAYVLRRSAASTADDIVAEVFVVCWRRFEEVPVDPLPWLLAVARRVLSTQRRGERRRGALHERLAGEAGAGVGNASEEFVAVAPTDFVTSTSADIAGDRLGDTASASRIRARSRSRV